MSDEVNDFLMGTGGRSASFKELNTRVWGEIVHSELRQQSKLGTGELLFWEDGKPRMQLVVTLQTSDQEDEEDDGVRKVYAKGNMLAAIRKAVVAAGARGIRPGGKLVIQYTGDGEVKQRGFNAPKLYFAKYQPPVESVSIPDDGGDDDGAPEPDDIPF